MSSLPQPLPPLPVQPIAYSTPVAHRPGLITAIGVCSIVVGSLGILFNGIAGLQAFGFMMVANMTKAMTAATVARTPTTAAPSASVDPMSMPLGDRRMVVNALNAIRPISPARRDHLDVLLARSGRQVFRLQGADLTAEVVRQNVTENGTRLSDDGNGRDDFFVIGEGTLVLADDHAKFLPADGRETVRASATDESAEQPNWQAGLTTAQVKGVVAHVEKQSAATLPPAVKSKLEQQLASPTQGYFVPAPTVQGVTSQISNVGYFDNGNGMLSVTTHHGMLTLDANGNVVNSTTWGGTGGFAAGPAGPPFTIDMTAAVVAIAGAAASLCLAIYLLVIGILMLRQHPRAGRLHKFYAWIKIPLAIAGGIAWVMLWTSFLTSINATAGAAVVPGKTAAIATGAIIAAVVGCIYPVSLLIALRTKSVREYYATVT